MRKTGQSTLTVKYTDGSGNLFKNKSTTLQPLGVHALDWHLLSAIASWLLSCKLLERAMMLVWRAVVTVTLVFVCSSAAFGWGHVGHETVGAVADGMLGANAAAQMETILGPITLRQAAPWADCIRDVGRRPDGTFEYVSDPKYHKPCIPFENPDGIARMVDYAKRNWDTCAPLPKGQGCHTQYHFADVAVQHDHYDRSFIGTSDDDIVSVTVAAIAVLQGKSAPAPFSIRDKQEALLLLAHFVGDMHQPLHVGAVYLDAKGKRIDPDSQGAPLDPETETHGGNSLDDGQTNLHSEWDTVSSSIHPTALSASIKQAAQAVNETGGDVSTWPAVWASETVMSSSKAFSGVSFRERTPKGHWLVVISDSTKYTKAMRKLQSDQLAKAGARLAQILNAIWP